MGRLNIHLLVLWIQKNIDCYLMLDDYQTETAIFSTKREEYFPMKPFAMVVPENVTTRTTKRVLENGLAVMFTH
jgi:hypothetical protein